MNHKTGLHLLPLLILMFTLPRAKSQTIGTDCNGKGFLCVDVDRYQVCVDLPNGSSGTVDAIAYPCASDSYCVSDGLLECDSLVRPSTPESTPSTTIYPTEPDSSSEGDDSDGTTFYSSDATLEPTFSSSDESSEESSSEYDVTESTSDDSESTNDFDSPTPETTSGSEFELETTEEASTTEQMSTTVESFVCKAPGRYPHEDDCHKYYHCLLLPDGLFVVEMSCFYNMAYDPATQRCVIDQSTCQPEQLFVCTAVGKFPDPSDAGKYFWCLQNGPDYQLYTMTCPSGHQFYVQVQQCRGPWVANESNGSSSSADSDDSASSDSSSESSDSSEE